MAGGAPEQRRPRPVRTSPADARTGTTPADAASTGAAAADATPTAGSRPGSSGSSRSSSEPVTIDSETSRPVRDARGRFVRRSPGNAVARQNEPAQQVAVAAGNAVVTAARVGRLLGRTGWRLARQLPVVKDVEAVVGAQVQRVGSSLAAEFARLLDSPAGVGARGTADEARTMALLQHAAQDPEPLRSAMTELLERSSLQDRGRGGDYLYGSIISQLVPDEARILSTLVGGREFAAVDVVVKPVRGNQRTELANASTVGRAAKVVLPANTGTYLSRLASLGLVEFGPPGDELASQFDALSEDPAVQRARVNAEGGKARISRKTVSLSAFGEQFWAACAPLPSASNHR